MRKALLVLAFCGFAASLLAEDAFIGTWKMNPAKSKFNGPPPKSMISKVDPPDKDGFQKVVIDTVEADGKTTHRTFTQKIDGKDYAETGDPYADMTSATKVDSNTLDYVYKKNGKEVSRGRVVVSKDGKTSLDTGSGKDAKGQVFTWSIFTERQ